MRLRPERTRQEAGSCQETEALHPCPHHQAHHCQEDTGQESRGQEDAGQEECQEDPRQEMSRIMNRTRNCLLFFDPLLSHTNEAAHHLEHCPRHAGGTARVMAAAFKFVFPKSCSYKQKLKCCSCTRETKIEMVGIFVFSTLAQGVQIKERQWTPQSTDCEPAHAGRSERKQCALPWYEKEYSRECKQIPF